MPFLLSAIFLAGSIAVSTALSTCATTRPAERGGAREPEHSFGFYNATGARLRECAARWKDGSAERRTAVGILFPRVFKINHYQHIAIPEKVMVSWRDADGKLHEAELEVARKVPDLKRFSGTIWFRIGDDGVKVVPRTYDEEDKLAAQQKPYWPK